MAAGLAGVLREGEAVRDPERKRDAAEADAACAVRLESGHRHMDTVPAWALPPPHASSTTAPRSRRSASAPLECRARQRILPERALEVHRDRAPGSAGQADRLEPPPATAPGGRHQRLQLRAWGTKWVVVLGLLVAAHDALLRVRHDHVVVRRRVPVRFLFGVGLGLTSAPATESIMGSLPPSRAGVGSAINDTAPAAARSASPSSAVCSSPRTTTTPTRRPASPRRRGPRCTTRWGGRSTWPPDSRPSRAKPWCSCHRRLRRQRCGSRIHRRGHHRLRRVHRLAVPPCARPRRVRVGREEKEAKWHAPRMYCLSREITSRPDVRRPMAAVPVKRRAFITLLMARRPAWPLAARRSGRRAFRGSAS